MAGKFFSVLLNDGGIGLERFNQDGPVRMTKWEALKTAKEAAKRGLTATILEAVEEYFPAEPVERKL
jgi:hypothetical protein